MLFNFVIVLYNDGVFLFLVVEIGGGERKLEVGGLMFIFWMGGVG